ncbi:Nif3-like dinuclear metal center hexameric protein [Treponema primitia]|uniref:Nif3-like dinuclear metal center hexameric protein n=1 Tax=Treponema primitia TaxID=88058 RepID=UPI0002554CF3|nr:Nif3-like dinuclear metal center hexameric protein [Treponema primitia]
MTSLKLDAYFRSLLDLEGFAGMDPSLNGIQVDNDGAEISKIAFAVDACLETFKRAADAGAGMLFVHHGLFWGQPLRVAGAHRERLRFLLEHNLALYGVHLPLDQHPSLGNNVGLAELLGIESLEPFGEYHGRKIGYKGTLAKPLTIEAAVKRISFKDRPPLGVYPFGKQENLSCAVISGGAAEEALQALDEGIDLYVTGEASHQIYHQALEGHLNMIAGGHYSTEVWGVRRVMENCAAQLNLELEFIDVPTGL